MDLTKLHPEYVTDEQGRRKAVILPIEEYDELLEDIDDLAVAAARRDEGTVSHRKVVEELKESGILPVEWKNTALRELKQLDRQVLQRLVDRSRRHSFGSAAGGSPQAHRLGPHVSNPGGRLSNRLRD